MAMVFPPSMPRPLAARRWRRLSADRGRDDNARAPAPVPPSCVPRGRGCRRQGSRDESAMTVRLIEGMRELAPYYDGFILDLWGVVHDGVAPYPGVLDCMGRLVGAAKRIVLLSNAPRRADDVVRRIEKIGVPRRLYHAVMSSGEEAWQHLHKRDEKFYAALGRRCLHVCSERDLEMREGLDLDWVATPDEADFILNTGPAEWEDTHEDYAPV